MKLKDIQPYPQNAKKHDKKQIQQIANSMQIILWYYVMVKM